MTISSYGLSLLLATVACVIGGTLGGLTLARPGTVLGLPPTSREPAPQGPWGPAEGTAPPVQATGLPWGEGRALGAALILSHATTALFLGYQSSLGAAMALALAMAWFGAAIGRGFSALVDRSRGGLNLSNLAFELLIAITLALPFFNPGRLVVLRGHGMLV